jgi:TM2 domain-containing membrane protein YozV
MTVYGDLTYAIEIGMAVIVVGLGLSAIIARRPELRNELLIIMAGLLIPLAILETVFSGLNDWEMGLTDLDGVIIPPLIVIWLSFMFWTTLTPSAIALIGIRLGLIQERIDPTGARKIWDYFLVWNKLLRIYAELNKWGAILVFLGFTVALPIYANIVDSQPTAYILFCFPLFFVILYFFQDRSKAPKSTNFSTPTGLVEFAEVANRMQETGFMEKVEEGGGKVLGVEGVAKLLLDSSQTNVNDIPKDEQVQPYVHSKEFVWAYIFAFMWPGLDRFYLGDNRKGALFSISALILLPTIVGSLVLWLVNLFSVYSRTDAYNLNAMREASLTTSVPGPFV